MNNFEKSREIWRQQLAIQVILWKCSNVLPFAFDKRYKDYYSGIRDPDKLIADFERYINHLDSSHRNKIRRLLANRIRSLAVGRKPTSTLEQRLNEISRSLKSSLASIAPSLDKAKGSLMAIVDVGDIESDQDYDAMCLLRENVPPGHVARVVSAWKDELRRFLNEQEKPIPVIKM